jgi:hypothetical protein
MTKFDDWHSDLDNFKERLKEKEGSDENDDSCLERLILWIVVLWVGLQQLLT